MSRWSKYYFFIPFSPGKFPVYNSAGGACYLYTGFNFAGKQVKMFIEPDNNIIRGAHKLRAIWGLNIIYPDSR
jgi:hypothetical protein